MERNVYRPRNFTLAGGVCSRPFLDYFTSSYKYWRYSFSLQEVAMSVPLKFLKPRSVAFLGLYVNISQIFSHFSCVFAPK